MKSSKISPDIEIVYKLGLISVSVELVVTILLEPT